MENQVTGTQCIAYRESLSEIAVVAVILISAAAVNGS